MNKNDCDCEGNICEHQFVFLREEKKNIGYDHTPKMLYEDVFFCERCLIYQRIKTRLEERQYDSFAMHVTERYT